MKTILKCVARKFPTQEVIQVLKQHFVDFFSPMYSILLFTGKQCIERRLSSLQDWRSIFHILAPNCGAFYQTAEQTMNAQLISVLRDVTTGAASDFLLLWLTHSSLAAITYSEHICTESSLIVLHLLNHVTVFSIWVLLRIIDLNVFSSLHIKWF